MARIGAAMCLGLGLSGSVATAASYTQYAGRWTIEVPVNPVVEATLESGDGVLVEGRLLPEGLAIAGADVADAASIRVRAGAQLIRINVAGGSIPSKHAYCTYRDITKSIARPLSGNVVSNKLVCLVDRNDDLAFDALTDCWAGFPSFLVQVHCNKPLAAIGPVAYRLEAPNKFESELTWGVERVDGQIKTRFGAKQAPLFFGIVSYSSRKLPQDVPIFNGVITLVSEQDDRLRFVVKKPISEQVVPLCGFWSILEPGKTCQ